jgi:hypothetical protein
MFAVVPSSAVETTENDLVLDMGTGEEGTGNLTVTYAGVVTNQTAVVTFLDVNKNVVGTGQLDLLTTTMTTVVPYNGDTPYRFVRFDSIASNYGIDAIQAASYVGDADGDGLPESFETQYGLNPNDPNGNNGAAGDPDGNNLTNLQEFQRGTNPTNADSDGDGLQDGFEVNNGLDPRDPNGTNGGTGDPDGDGRTNAQEQTARIDPNNADTDGDGLPDGFEVRYEVDPNDATGDNGAQGDPIGMD